MEDWLVILDASLPVNCQSKLISLRFGWEISPRKRGVFASGAEAMFPALCLCKAQGR